MLNTLQNSQRQDAIPVLYSFRRCPYAIRARLALAVAGLRPGIDLELREVNLRARPAELRQASAKATVPVLVLPPEPGAPALVLDQSLEIMLWALARHDPLGWLTPPLQPLAAPAATLARQEKMAAQGVDAAATAAILARLAPPPAASEPEAAAAERGGWALITELIAQNDGAFKHHLDRFRYPDRFLSEQQHESSPPPHSQGSGRRQTGIPASSATDSGTPADSAQTWRQRHRQAARRILQQWNARLQQGPWLLGERPCLADIALLPFVRQFQLADPHGFNADGELAALRRWLERLLNWPLLAEVMEQPWGPRCSWHSPRWLYHLALSEEWRQAQADGVYRRSSRGLALEQVGFVHACQAHQLAATHQRFYADLPANAVRLLSLDPDRLAQLGVPIRYEPAAESGEMFPHLYGPLPLEAVLLAEPYRPLDDPTGSAQALQQDSRRPPLARSLPEPKPAEQRLWRQPGPQERP